MIGLNMPKVLLLIGVCLVCMQVITSEARSLGRRKRYTSPHEQLHRKRRQLERMYNQLLVIYHFMDINDDPQSMTPVAIHFDQPENENVRQVMQTLNNPPDPAPRANRTEEQVESGGQHLDFQARLERYMASSGETLNGNGAGFRRTQLSNRNDDRDRSLNGNHRPQSRGIPFGKGLRVRIRGTFADNTRRLEVETAVLMQKVLELCRIVNERVNAVSPGVKVKTCTMQ